MHGNGIVDEYTAFRSVLGDSDDLENWLRQGENEIKPGSGILDFDTGINVGVPGFCRIKSKLYAASGKQPSCRGVLGCIGKKVRLIPSGLIIVMVLAVDPMISPEIADEMECLLACSGISPVIPSTVMPSRVVPLNSPV